jgi:hypothetical protein
MLKFLKPLFLLSTICLIFVVGLKCIESAKASSSVRELTDESKSSLVQLIFEQTLKEKLFGGYSSSSVATNKTSISAATPVDSFSSFERNLHKFQDDLVRKRNAHCLHEKYGYFDWSLIKFQNLNESLFGTDVAGDGGDRQPYLDLNRYAELREELVAELSGKCINSSSLLGLFVNESNYQTDAEYVYRIVLSQMSNHGCNLCDEPEIVPTITKAESRVWVFFWK